MKRGTKNNLESGTHLDRDVNILREENKNPDKY
jgi:hypothetical protein